MWIWSRIAWRGEVLFFHFFFLFSFISFVVSACGGLGLFGKVDFFWGGLEIDWEGFFFSFSFLFFSAV